MNNLATRRQGSSDSSLHVVTVGTPMTVGDPFAADFHSPGDFLGITCSNRARHLYAGVLHLWLCGAGWPVV